MYSFYGGRPGNSFVIITTYRSIADMVERFKQGPNYTAVHYDEYVMINTVNKNDPDNGKIYRRGYDFTNDVGGAEFVGTIVGPAGHAPMLEITTLSDVESKHASQGYSERRSSGQYSVTNGSLIPGKTDTDFNDKITWECCSIRNQDNTDTTAYIGFIIPYTVIDYETSVVEPYTNGVYADTTSITRIDDQTHPFFEKWHVNIPKGVKGDAFMNLKVETASANIQDYQGRADDVNNSRAVIAYDYYNYDNFQNGNPVRLYLGDYNMIEDISINDEGTLTVEYTHDDDKIFNKQLKWVKSISLNNETGLFTLVYNHTTDAEGSPTTYTTYLDWIKEVNIANDGTVTFDHTHNADTIFDKKIQWCTGVSINNDGTMTFTWNNGTQDTVFNNVIQWISSVNLAADGTLTVGYNNGAEDTVFSQAIKWITDVQLANDGTLTVTYNNNDAYTAFQKIRWITDVQLASNGTLTIKYNNGNDTVFNNAIKSMQDIEMLNSGSLTIRWNDGTVTAFPSLLRWIDTASLDDDGRLSFHWNDGATTRTRNALRWISNIQINTGETQGSSNQKFKITWNDGVVEDIGNPINYILNMVVNENNHLLVRYSDPNKRAGGLTYNNVEGWTDLGRITERYEYNPGTDLYGISDYSGYGVLENDMSTNYYRFTFYITPTAYLNPEINNIGASMEIQVGEDRTRAITNDLIDVAKTFAGLRVQINRLYPVQQENIGHTVYQRLPFTMTGVFGFSTTSPQGG